MADSTLPFEELIPEPGASTEELYAHLKQAFLSAKNYKNSEPNLPLYLAGFQATTQLIVAKEIRSVIAQQGKWQTVWTALLTVATVALVAVTFMLYLATRNLA